MNKAIRFCPPEVDESRCAPACRQAGLPISPSGRFYKFFKYSFPNPDFKYLALSLILTLLVYSFINIISNVKYAQIAYFG